MGKRMKKEETQASKWVSVALSAQFVVSMFNCLARSDVTPVLCLIGFYAVQERKRNATRTFMVFLVLSVFLDVVWLSVYGGYIHNFLATVKWQNVAQTRVNGLLKFVYITSVILLIIKVVSVYFVYNFLIELQGGAGEYSRQDVERGLTEGSSLTGSYGDNAKSTAAGPSEGSSSKTGFGSDTAGS